MPPTVKFRPRIYFAIMLDSLILRQHVSICRMDIDMWLHLAVLKVMPWGLVDRLTGID